MSELSNEDRRIVWEQFVEVYARSQEAFDTSARTLAAGSVAVTVSLGTALDDLSGCGIAAVTVFLGALAANLLSYVTAQLDMRRRLGGLRDDEQGAELGNAWTVATHVLNAVSGTALVIGGILLATFVASAA